MSNNPFQVGGALLADSPVYIERRADADARDLLDQMKYITMIAPRQQGKTSLINCLMGSMGVSEDTPNRSHFFAVADLTVWNGLPERDWYEALCEFILDQLWFIPDNKRPELPSNSSSWSWLKFLTGLGKLAKKGQVNIVIALDEVGATPQDWATTFFSTIRSIFNYRGNQIHFRYLTFILAGAYNPRTLIRDPNISPFNIAHPIHIVDFTVEQIESLTTHLSTSPKIQTSLVERIHYWTDGQPYLTQWICRSLVGQTLTKESVDTAVKRLRREDSNHLPHIFDSFNKDKKLKRYVERIAGGYHPAFTPDESSRHMKLALAGIIKADEGHCRIRNRIYEQALQTDIPDIQQNLSLTNPDQITASIETSLAKTRPHLFDHDGLCANYPLEPSPGEYFVAHEVSPEKIEDLRHALKKGLDSRQLKPYTADQDIRPGHILCKIAAKIQTTAFCIFDLPQSPANPSATNVYLELGIAIGLGRPFILVKNDRATVPSLLEGLDTFGFSSYSGLRREVGEQVQVGQFSAILPQEDVFPTATCFLADGEFEQEDFRGAIHNALEDYGLQPIYLAEGQVEPALVLTQLIRNIQAARFGIYRIDQQASANTFLTLGIAIGLNKPWLLIAREGAAIPQDVRGLSNFNFRSFTQLEAEFAKRCKTFLERYVSKTYVKQVPPVPLEPSTLLDFSQATPSSLDQDWEPYGNEDGIVSCHLEVDPQLGPILVKSGRGFHAALRHPPDNAPSLRWSPFRYYEIIVKSSDQNLVLHINVGIEEGEDRTLLYGPAQRYGPNPEEPEKEFQHPLDEMVCDGTWHSVIVDLIEDVQKAGWSTFWSVRWLALHGEAMLCRIRGSNDLSALKGTAINPVYKTTGQRASPVAGPEEETYYPFTLQEKRMNKNWFPSDSAIPLREALLDCGPFDTDRQLRAVFAYPPLRLWRDRLPGADNRQDRVDFTIEFLLGKHTSDEKNGLILFLRALVERTDPGNACHPRLAELADALERAYSGDISDSSDQGIETVDSEEIASLKRQLTNLKRNLLTIEEQKTEFIDPRSIPPDLAESEKLIREKIVQIEARLADLEP